MRHKLKTNRLSRATAPRLALLRNLSTSLIQHEQIQTTLVKAKSLRSFLEPLVTFAKNCKNDLYKIRRLLSKTGSYPSVRKLIDVLSKRYKNRPGGYLRIMRSGFRKGDNAPMAYVEFVDNNIEAKGCSFDEQKKKTKTKSNIKKINQNKTKKTNNNLEGKDG